MIGCAAPQDNHFGAPAPAAAPAPEAMFMTDMAEVAYSFTMAEEAAMWAADDSYGGGSSLTLERQRQEQKVILESSLDIATDRFDEVSARIRGVAAENDGFVQSSEQITMGGVSDLRRLSITIRVPQERYEAVFTQLKTLGVLRSANESQRNVTTEYYDMRARLRTRLIEEERLLALIERTETIEDILELEALLGNVRTQIEVLQTQMTSIDRLVSHSTIHIFVMEVEDETTVIMPANLSERVYASFIRSVNQTLRFAQGVLVFLVGISVPLFVALVAGAVIWGLFRITRFSKKKDSYR